MSGEGVAGTLRAASVAPPSGKTRPSAVWYWIAVALIVAGIIGGGALAVVTAVDAYDRVMDFPSAAVPGEVSFEVTKSGDQLVYYRGATGSLGENPWRQLGLQVSGPDGQPVPVRNYMPGTAAAARDFAYYVHDSGFEGGEELVRGRNDFGAAIATFTADSTGQYRLTTTTATESGAELAVGENLVRTLIVRLFGAAGIAIVGLVSGLTLIVVTAVRRSRVRAA